MAVGTGYRSGTRVETEGAPSTDFGADMQQVLSAGSEPDLQAERDGARLMARPMSADISGDLEGAAGKIVGVLVGRPGFAGRRIEASCGCGRYTCCDEGKRLSRESQDAYRTDAYPGLVSELREHRVAAEAEISAGAGAA